MSNVSSLDAKVVTMTPAKAASYIKRHMAAVKDDESKRNRKVSNAAIARYAADMKEGRWQLNAETVKIAGDGQVLDGQHRLLACVQANASFQTLLVEGVASDSFQSIDIGVPRSGGNLLYLAGHKNNTVLASALTLLWRWEQGGGKLFDRWSQTPSKPELFPLLERYPDIEEFVKKTVSNQYKTIASCGLLATCWYLFSLRDRALADTFFESLGSGVGLKADDPVYTLRERLLKDRAQAAARGGGKMSMEMAAELLLRAWNATRKGEKLVRMNLPRGTREGGKGRDFQLRPLSKAAMKRAARAAKEARAQA